MILLSDKVYNWTPQEYIQYVENTTNPMLKGYQEIELQHILNINSPKTKTFIDEGAGYGRVISQVAKVARNVIAIELNDELFKELKKRCDRLRNAKAIKGNADFLSELLREQDIQHPVVLCLQNSLGTWEGDYKKASAEMKKVAKNQGEVIISLFIQEGLRNYGIDMYNSLSLS